MPLILRNVKGSSLTYTEMDDNLTYLEGLALTAGVTGATGPGGSTGPTGTAGTTGSQGATGPTGTGQVLPGNLGVILISDGAGGATGSQNLFFNTSTNKAFLFTLSTK